MTLSSEKESSSSIGTFQLFHFKIIDYAGLFPPASLSLDESMKNFANYRESTEKWMLSRFIIPATQLEELSKYKELFTKNPPFLFSVLNKPTSTIEEFSLNLGSVLRNISKVEQELKESIKIDALELKLPIFPKDGDFNKFFNKIVESINKQVLQEKIKESLEIFLEITTEESFFEILRIILPSISKFNSDKTNNKINYLGFKLRTGGVTSETFPSVEKVAQVIKLCSENQVPLKATAGLHHPIRHYNESVKTKMHGFINIFGASILNEGNSLDIKTIEDIITEEEPSNFRFTEGSFSWKNIETHSEIIYKSRIKKIISFGSCSFDEPREDLKNLKLL